MDNHKSFQVRAYHSCDKEVGLKILNGKEDLKISDNPWDWLGEGIYFWEESPMRALEYAEESANGQQFNKIPIKTPFVLGANIELGNCLDLMLPSSAAILKEAYDGLERVYKEIGKKMPINKGNNRALDCAVIKYVHQSGKLAFKEPYDTIRSAFNEGENIYPGASFTCRLHIQLCVLNPVMIRGYFLPRPIAKYNPYLHKPLIRVQPLEGNPRSTIS